MLQLRMGYIVNVPILYCILPLMPTIIAAQIQKDNNLNIEFLTCEHCDEQI